MTEDKSLAELQAGDSVVLWPPEYLARMPEVTTVERATKTQLTVAGNRFMRTRGHEMGLGPYDSGYRIYPATPEHVARVNRRRAEMELKERKQRAIRRLQSADLMRLSVEQLEHLVEMTDAALKEGSDGR